MCQPYCSNTWGGHGIALSLSGCTKTKCAKQKESEWLNAALSGSVQPDPHQQGHYYIGSLHGSYPTKQIKSKVNLVEDVATFDEFPFTRTCQLRPNTQQTIRNTVLCVTTRLLTSEELRDAQRGLNSGNQAEKDSSESGSSAGRPKQRTKRQ